ncbi:hypothetical protein ACUN0C_19355 [Faunimonas sp. B44]|uniref:hypothetical protein n=1 Tax=Faunimonas sp. B44 TaxID=3461493 RepID=UPI0040449437
MTDEPIYVRRLRNPDRLRFEYQAGPAEPAILIEILAEGNGQEQLTPESARKAVQEIAARFHEAAQGERFA